MRKRTRPEQVIQRTVFEHIAQRGAQGLVAWHVPNGGKRSPIEAAIFQGLGVRQGVSDVHMLHRGRFFTLELKAANGRPTVAQMQFASDVNAAGGTAAIASGLDEAIRTLETWGLLRGRAT